MRCAVNDGVEDDQIIDAVPAVLSKTTSATIRRQNGPRATSPRRFLGMTRRRRRRRTPSACQNLRRPWPEDDEGAEQLAAGRRVDEKSQGEIPSAWLLRHVEPLMAGAPSNGPLFQVAGGEDKITPTVARRGGFSGNPQSLTDDHRRRVLILLGRLSVDFEHGDEAC